MSKGCRGKRRGTFFQQHSKKNLQQKIYFFMRLLWQGFIPWVCEQTQKASETNTRLCTLSQKTKKLFHHNAIWERNLSGLKLSRHLFGRRSHPCKSFFWTSLEGEFAILSQTVSLRCFPQLHYFHYRPAVSKDSVQQARVTRARERTMIQVLPSTCPVQGSLYLKLLVFCKWETHIAKRYLHRFWLVFRDLKTWQFQLCSL